jgi:IclR family KDG regulon transcriptional repressor
MSAINHAMTVLGLFTREVRELGVREMSRRTGLSKSTVHRVVSELAAGRFLEKDPQSGRYRLGIRLLELGGLVQTQLELSETVEPILRTLVRLSGESVHLGILDDLEVVRATKVEGAHEDRLHSYLGERLPLYCTAGGKVILAFRGPELTERVIAHGLQPRTRHTLVNPKDLRAHLRDVRNQGYALDLDELHEGLRCVGAPIRDGTGAVIGAVTIVGPAARLPLDRLRLLAGPVVEAAREVSRRLEARQLAAVRVDVWRASAGPHPRPLG